MSSVSREEWAIVIHSLDECVNRLSISKNWGNDDTTMFVFDCFWGAHWLSTSFDSFIVNTSSIIYGKSNISDGISVFYEMLIYLWVFI
jgi:hypothetical protein